jgi:hypothetical protein
MSLGSSAQLLGSMSSANLNNENNFSDRPDRTHSFEELVRTYGSVSPKLFFDELRRAVGSRAVAQPDCERAVFLYERVERARRRIAWFLKILIVASVLPFLCLALHGGWRMPAFFAGLMFELVTATCLVLAHAQWSNRRKDYIKWLCLVRRRFAEH